MSQKNVDFLKKVKYQYKKQMPVPSESVVVKSSQRLLNAQINDGDVIVDAEMPQEVLESTVDWDEGVVNDLIVKIDANDDSVYVIQDLGEEPNVPNENIDTYVDSLGNDYSSTSLSDSLIAVGFGTTSACIQTSLDGITWNQVGQIFDGQLYDVCYAYNLGMYFAIGASSTNNGQYSYDGVNWIGIVIGNGVLRTVCYSESLGMFITGGIVSSGQAKYSTDGLTWNVIPNIPDGGFLDVMFEETLGMFVALDYAASNNIKYSYDGLNWTGVTVPPEGNSTGGERAICYSKKLGEFLTVGINSNNNVFHSTDGINWTISTCYMQELVDVCYSEKLELFVAVSSSTSGINLGNNIAYSTDGLNWNFTTSAASELTSIEYSEIEEVFVAVGRASTLNVQYSTDAINWTAVSVPDGDLQSVIFKDADGDSYVSENYND